MATNAETAFELFTATLGQPEGTGEWFEVTQEQVNQFADVTLDHQFIHIDPEAADDWVRENFQSTNGGGE